MKAEVTDHFTTKVLQTAARYQYVDSEMFPHDSTGLCDANNVGEQVLNGIKNMHPSKVRTKLT